MENNQAEFKGWAKVEVMGHQSHIGYVETQAFGATVLFRIDQPAIPACEETLERSAWVGETYAGPGSLVQRPEIPASTVLVGSGSIYRIIPCDEATAITAIRQNERRPLILVKLAEAPRLTAPVEDEEVPYSTARKYDILHVEQLVEESFEAFCAEHEITSRKDKQAVLQAFADTAKAMKGRQN